MKKNYIIPQAEVETLVIENEVLAGSLSLNDETTTNQLSKDDKDENFGW